jgi:hypothetical protein
VLGEHRRRAAPAAHAVPALAHRRVLRGVCVRVCVCGGGGVFEWRSRGGWERGAARRGCGGGGARGACGFCCSTDVQAACVCEGASVFLRAAAGSLP